MDFRCLTFGESLLARERGLKLTAGAALAGGHRSLLARERGLKPVAEALGGADAVSLLARERGLDAELQNLDEEAEHGGE